MPHTNARLKIFAAIWLGLVFGSLAALSWYKTRPGESASVSSVMPDDPRVTIDDHAPFTLVLFAHPKCDCSKATLYELRRLLRETDRRVAPVVVFYYPEDQTEDWARTKLWKDAEAMGARIATDRGGRLAFRFGARTSGETFLYGREKRLAFHGGLTETRGHIGESAGGRAIASISLGQPVSLKNTKAFGCSLFSAAELKHLQAESTGSGQNVKN